MMTLLFEIKPGAGKAIYRQIIEQVKRLVASGHLKAGDELPSVRSMSASFDINPMTVSKAYSMLEETGVLERIRGKGMIVSNQKEGEEDISKRLELIAPVLEEAVSQAKQLNIEPEQLIAELSKYLGRKK